MISLLLLRCCSLLAACCCCGHVLWQRLPHCKWGLQAWHLAMCRPTLQALLGAAAVGEWVDNCVVVHLTCSIAWQHACAGGGASALDCMSHPALGCGHLLCLLAGHVRAVQQGVQQEECCACIRCRAWWCCCTHGRSCCLAMHGTRALEEVGAAGLVGADLCLLLCTAGEW